MKGEGVQEPWLACVYFFLFFLLGGLGIGAGRCHRAGMRFPTLRTVVERIGEHVGAVQLNYRIADIGLIRLLVGQALRVRLRVGIPECVRVLDLASCPEHSAGLVPHGN